MNCQEILDKLSDYIDRELDPSLCEEIERHVEDCEPCVAFINTLKKTVEVFRNKPREPEQIPSDISVKLKNFLKQNIGEHP